MKTKTTLQITEISKFELWQRMMKIKNRHRTWRLRTNTRDTMTAKQDVGLIFLFRAK